MGETLALNRDALQKAGAAAPFTASTGGAGVVVFPVTVQQYVSLRADLASRQDQASETRSRYAVPNEAARRALVSARTSPS